MDFEDFNVVLTPRKGDGSGCRAPVSAFSRSEQEGSTSMDRSAGATGAQGMG